MTWLDTASLAHAFLEFCENIMPQFLLKKSTATLTSLVRYWSFKNQRPKGFFEIIKA